MSDVPLELTHRLSAAHLEMLRRGSGISDAVIAARGYRTVTDPKELAALGFTPQQRRVPGLLLPLWAPDAGAPGPDPRSYSLVFDEPGTYEYACTLHDGMGMVGTITVVAQGTPTTLPVTGGSTPYGLPLPFGPLALAALASALIVVGLLIRRRHVGA